MLRVVAGRSLSSSFHRTVQCSDPDVVAATTALHPSSPGSRSSATCFNLADLECSRAAMSSSPVFDVAPVVPVNSVSADVVDRGVVVSTEHDAAVIDSDMSTIISRFLPLKPLGSPVSMMSVDKLVVESMMSYDELVVHLEIHPVADHLVTLNPHESQVILTRSTFSLCLRCPQEQTDTYPVFHPFHHRAHRSHQLHRLWTLCWARRLDCLTATSGVRLRHCRLLTMQRTCIFCRSHCFLSRMRYFLTPTRPGGWF